MRLPLTDLEEAIAGEVFARLAATHGKTIHAVRMESIGEGPAVALMLDNIVLVGSPQGDIRAIARALVDRLDGTAARQEAEMQDSSDALPDEELLTAKDAAHRLSVSVATLKNACNNKQVPGARKFGRAWVIPAASLPLAQVHKKMGRPRSASAPESKIL